MGSNPTVSVFYFLKAEKEVGFVKVVMQKLSGLGTSELLFFSAILAWRPYIYGFKLSTDQTLPSVIMVTAPFCIVQNSFALIFFTRCLVSFDGCP